MISFEDFYRQEYARFVKTATFIVGDLGEAEELVQEGFVKAHQRWQKLTDPGAYLYVCVVNGCRDRLRRRSVGDRHLALVAPAAPEDERQEPHAADRVDLVRGLRELSHRQRTAIVLRYYAGLSVEEVASSMRVRPGTVKSLIHRGIARLRGTVEP